MSDWFPASLEKYWRFTRTGEGKASVPMKLRELVMVIEIEVNKLYDPGGYDRKYGVPKPSLLKEAKLS